MAPPSSVATGSIASCESCSDAIAAIRREKQIKSWTRAKKLALIESANPTWRDLGADP